MPCARAAASRAAKKRFSARDEIALVFSGREGKERSRGLQNLIFRGKAREALLESRAKATKKEGGTEGIKKKKKDAGHFHAEGRIIALFSGTAESYLIDKNVED